MLNVSISKVNGLRSFDLTEDEAKAIALIRTFKTHQDRQLVLDMLQHICDARDAPPPR